MSKPSGIVKRVLRSLVGLLLAAVLGAWLYAYSTRVEMANLMVVNADEAKDMQVLEAPLRTDPPTDTSSTVSRNSATGGDTSSVEPLNDIAKHHWFQYLLAEIFGFPVPVASAYLANTYNDWPKGKHTVNLHFTGLTWYATIDSFHGSRINVERYKYRGNTHQTAITQRDSFPNTARFDASDDTPSRVLIGIPCDLAWCVLGVKDGYRRDKVDPLDNAKTPVPVQRRVRGWYDRKFDPTTGRWLFIFPEPGIADYKEEKIVGQTLLFATIIESGYPDSEKVYINYEGGETWTPYPYPVGATDIKRVKNPAHPDLGAARWRSAFYASGKNPSSGARSFAFMAFGDMWVRCASGCCEVTLQ